MATIAILSPNSAEFPSANFPERTTIHATARRPILWFDETTAETCYWTIVAPTGFTGTMTAVVSFVMETATTGTFAVDISVEAITSLDAVDLDAAESFDTVNGAESGDVADTVGFMEQLSVTLTNQDSAAAADYLRIRLARDVAEDNAADDAGVLLVELRDAS